MCRHGGNWVRMVSSSVTKSYEKPTRLASPGEWAPRANAPEARPCGSDPIPILRLRMLGGFSVERADVGQAVSGWPRRSAKTLIKLLAVQPEHALHREQVIDVL